LKEKLRLLLKLKVPDNMSLIPLTRDHIKKILRAYSGEDVKLLSTLNLNMET
jgi:hypothetical protein